MVDVVEGSLNVCIDHPLFPLVGAGQLVDLCDGILGTSPRPEPVTTALELCLPFRLQNVLNPGLKAAVDDGRDPEGAALAVGFRYVHPPDGLHPPVLKGGQLVHQLASGGWRFDHQLIDPRRVLAGIDLCNLANAQQSIRMATQHELLQRAQFPPCARLCRPEDAPSQVADDPLGLAPVDGSPVGPSRRSVCGTEGSHLTCPLISNHYRVLRVAHQVHVSRLSAWAVPYPPGYGFPLPFGGWRSLFGPSYSQERIRPPLRSAYWTGQTFRGLPRSAPVRRDWGGCPLYPGGQGVYAGDNFRFPCHCPEMLISWLLTRSSPSWLTIIPAISSHGASSRVHSHSPVQPFPRLVTRMVRGLLGLYPLLRTSPLPGTHAGIGNRRRTLAGVENFLDHSSGATSCRKKT